MLLAHMLEQTSKGLAAQIKTHALLFGQSGQLWSSDTLQTLIIYTSFIIHHISI